MILFIGQIQNWQIDSDRKYISGCLWQVEANHRRGQYLSLLQYAFLFSRHNKVCEDVCKYSLHRFFRWTVAKDIALQIELLTKPDHLSVILWSNTKERPNYWKLFSYYTYVSWHICTHTSHPPHTLNECNFKIRKWILWMHKYFNFNEVQIFIRSRFFQTWKEKRLTDIYVPYYLTLDSTSQSILAW